MYPPAVARHSALRIVFTLIICVALLLPTNISWLVRGEAQGIGPTPAARPRPGAPEGTWPGLEDIKNESQLAREAPPPIPSAIRSLKNSGKPWDGRRVGDAEPPRSLGQPNGDDQVRRAHAHRRMRIPPLLPDDQFVQNFFSLALLRSPTADEASYWYSQMRVAYGQGQASLKLAAIELGKTLFESAQYAARSRDPHWYVYDLYKTYLMREPDSGGWTTWESLVPSYGREYVRRGFEESGEFATLVASMTPNGSIPANAASLISARVDPRNQPGNGMLSRDANWSVPLLSLPGRNGLDLGLTLSYSSMVWTHSGPYFYFDEDNGFPSPGFRLGFPTVQRKVFDAETVKNAYLLITPTGDRVELRQLSANVYETGDSSYLQLTDNGTSLTLRTTDGTQLGFVEGNSEYRCTYIKDRNGNYITVNYDALGHVTNISDTLGRLIVFNYDSNANLLSITQSWNGQPSHQLVSFGWSTRTMQSSFPAAAVIGTANNTVLPVVTQVALNDTSYFTFDYTNSLQVSIVRNYFGALERNATTFNYETTTTDVPRLVSSSVSAHNWSGYNNVPAQVTTQYSIAADGACVLTAPDGTVYKQYYGSGWQKGLTTVSEVWSANARQKWTTTAWTQDNTSVGYEVNPRVTEINVYDASGNRRRTTIEYGQYAQYGLPYIVREFATDAVTEIRKTVTDYNLSQTYLNQRIIGLVSEVQLKNGGGQPYSKTTYSYDDPARLQALPAAATQHDPAYGASFTARGNVTAVSRWDVTDINTEAKKLTTFTNYATTGSPLSTTDPVGHQNSISYTDAFSDGGNRNTFAYPTRLTDADGFSSYLQYNFDFGATTRTQSPAPAGQSQGAIQTMTYNSLGQLERVTTTNNGAYKRFWYGAEYTASYATVNNIADESYSVQVMDGLGRVIGAVRNHPGSVGGYSLVNTVYDQMGRAWLQSNPTEVNSAWVPSGDDAAGAYYTTQTYDWSGRLRITTYPDSSTAEASYAGCGCAGGAVVTMTDEVGRRQKVYSDIQGRQVKMEVMNWNNSIYSTRTTTYNARDQIETVRQFEGPESTGVHQQITKSYDGYGRLISEKHPIQSTATVYTYNADNQPLTITDARGMTQTFTYNSRDLPTAVSYNGGPASVTIAYDGAGNRTLMTDSTGSRSYQYNQLSQLTSETRQFIGLSGSFTLSYEYNLAGALKAFTDHVGSRVDYVFNPAGMLTAVSGSGAHSTPSYASNIAYRASGSIKDFDYGNGVHQHLNFNSRLRNTSLTLTLGTSGSTWTFNYYADGKLQKVTDSNNPIFDRAFDYDQVGRLLQARTGSEARGGTTPDGPFRQTYSYDVWENTVSQTNRLWTESPVTNGGTFTNNRNGNWAYDNEGNLLSNYDASFGYDVAGRQSSFASNVFIGGWPTSYPSESVLEVSQTFDGNSAPAKKTTINRWEEFVGEEYQIHESTESVYYLRSTALGGQVVAELDETGYKHLGYVLAGGMRLATQYVWNPGNGYEVAWVSTSPATGSEYMPTPYFMGRTELDPLGNDITYSPQPNVVLEPVFYNPKFDQMPLEIEGGPSEEYQLANAAWANLMAVTFQSIYDRNRAEQLWQSGKRSEAMAILSRNPNIGIEFRAIYKNEVIRSGSYFGKDAADFLNRINTAVDMGLLSPVRTASASNLVGGDGAGGIPQNPLPGFGKDNLGDINKAIKEGAKLLSKADCQKGLAAAGISVSDVNKIFGTLKARPASDPSTQGYNIFNAEKSTDPQVQQFLQSEKGKGAGGFIYGQDIMLRDAFFGARGAARINGKVSRALALIHEVIHLTGKTDADFNGSSKLNDVVIHACYSKLFGHTDLAIVGN